MPLGLTRARSLLSVEYNDLPPPGGPPTNWTPMTQQIWSDVNNNFSGFTPDGNGNVYTTALRTNVANDNIRELIQMTSDLGETWQVGTSDSGWDIVLHLGNWYTSYGTTVYKASDPLGVWTTDNTLSMTQRNLVSNGDRLITMGGRQSFLGNTPSGILIDNIWFKLDTGGQNSQVPSKSLANDSANPTTWINTVGAGSGFQISTDNGATWTQKSTPKQAHCCGIHDGTILVPSSEKWVLRSLDGGDNWDLISTATIPISTWHNATTDELGNWLVVGSGGRAMYSGDDGLTWTQLPDGLNTGDTATATFSACNYIGGGYWMAGQRNGYASIGTA